MADIASKSDNQQKDWGNPCSKHCCTKLHIFPYSPEISIYNIHNQYNDTDLDQKILEMRKRSAICYLTNERNPDPPYFNFTTHVLEALSAREFFHVSENVDFNFLAHVRDKVSEEGYEIYTFIPLDPLNDPISPALISMSLNSLVAYKPYFLSNISEGDKERDKVYDKDKINYQKQLIFLLNQFERILEFVTSAYYRTELLGRYLVEKSTNNEIPDFNEFWEKVKMNNMVFTTADGGLKSLKGNTYQAMLIKEQNSQYEAPKSKSNHTKTESLTGPSSLLFRVFTNYEDQRLIVDRRLQSLTVLKVELFNMMSYLASLIKKQTYCIKTENILPVSLSLLGENTVLYTRQLSKKCPVCDSGKCQKSRCKKKIKCLKKINILPSSLNTEDTEDTFAFPTKDEFLKTVNQIISEYIQPVDTNADDTNDNKAQTKSTKLVNNSSDQTNQPDKTKSVEALNTVTSTQLLPKVDERSLNNIKKDVSNLDQSTKNNLSTESDKPLLKTSDSAYKRPSEVRSTEKSEQVLSIEQKKVDNVVTRPLDSVNLNDSGSKDKVDVKADVKPPATPDDLYNLYNKSKKV